MDKSMVDERKRANDLSGRDWIRYSLSIWNDIQKTSEEKKLKHPAMFPGMLVERLLQCFTNQFEKNVLDPFAGVGSTIIKAQEMGKSGFGIELNPDFVEIINERLSYYQLSLLNKNSLGNSKIINDDALNLLDHFEKNSMDIVITSPPYWDILEMKRTADYKEIRNYGNELQDLGKINDYHEFVDSLSSVFRGVFDVLKPGKYCIIVVMDIRKKSKFYPFHMDVSRMMEKIGFIFDDIIIWDRSSEYNNLRSLGYPYVFRINKIHEFILIFQKPKEK